MSDTPVVTHGCMTVDKTDGSVYGERQSCVGFCEVTPSDPPQQFLVSGVRRNRSSKSSIYSIIRA